MKRLVQTGVAVLAGVILGYGVASIRTTPAVVRAQEVASPTMCSNGGGIPSGYVVVGESNTSTCVSPVDGTSGYLYQLRRLKPDASGGTSAVICTGTPVPSGFVTTGWNHNPGVCAVAGAPVLNQQSISLYY